MVHLWEVAKNAQAEWNGESNSHRKRTKATMAEGINPITTKKQKLFHRFALFALLTRPNEAETAVHGC